MRVSGPPTPGQRRVLNAVKAYLAREGIPPTLRELASELDMGSTNNIAEHLSLLEAKGYIARRPLQSRSIRVLRP